jgi:pSer/pThr/pTyr-binding forkhead associated (FHA) protein
MADSTDLVPVLLGTAGMVDGECFLLESGKDVVLGRSRSCDISLRRTATYLKTPPAQRDADHDFNTVSRRHIRLNVTDKTAHIQDLSTNGSFCNGEPMREPLNIDLSAGPCTLRMGTRESVQLIFLPADDPRLKQAQPVSMHAEKELKNTDSSKEADD